MQTQITLLNNDWRVREVPQPGASPTTHLPWMPATVPGHVHLDLMRADVIPDPYVGMHERGVAWVDEADWVYETIISLDAPVAAHTLLVFDGLDTVAEIVLNGELLGQTDNMFIPHEFPVGDKLHVGDNTLQVTFRSAMRVGKERMDAWQASGTDVVTPEWFRWSPRSFVRKSQYMYGWDWGPELLSCGLWRPVRLIQIPTARVLDWQYDVQFLDTGAAEVTLTAYVERASNATATPLEFTAALTRVGNETDAFDDLLPPSVTASVPEGTGRLSVSVSITIDNPRLWWPNRHNPAGAGVHPALYTVEMILGDAESKIAKLGLRTIELIREPDADGQGEGFQFRVNGEDIFIKGANWIPSDSFPSRLENEAGRLESDTDDGDNRVYNLIWASCDAGLNMLRVWGGGLYESEHFYELCDEHGILVWQDFAYACAYYPDTSVYAEAAHAEAIAVVRRLRVHPSLALWCGNNENQQMMSENWQDLFPSRFLGEHLYHRVLPAVVAAEDANTPYWPGSPFGGERPNSPDFGDRHNWDVWHGIGDWKNYTADNSRFCSEFGFASSCALPTWETVLSRPEDWDVQSSAVRWHDKTRKGYDTYLGFIDLHYPKSETLTDLVYYSQINQADALKFGIEHYRRLKGRCWGTLFWQINDCWPTHSWAIIDSNLEPKAAYFAAKKFYAPILLSLVRKENEVEVHLTNDRLAPISGSVTVSLVTFDGEVIAKRLAEGNVDANSTRVVTTFPLELALGRETSLYVAAVFLPSTGEEAVNNLLLLAEPKELDLPDSGLTVSIEDEDDEMLLVHVTAQRLAPYVWLHTSTTPAEFDDNFFHLAPGETHEVALPKTDILDSVDALSAYLVVRSLFTEVLP